MPDEIENSEIPVSEETENIGERLKLGMMGQRIRAGHAKASPIGDTMIKAVRNAIWEAWELGLDDCGRHVYPSIPLLDREGIEPEV